LKGVYSGIIIFLPVVFPVESRLDPGEAGGLTLFYRAGAKKLFSLTFFQPGSCGGERKKLEK